MTTTQLDPAVALTDLQTSKPERVTIVLLSGDMDRAMAAFIIAGVVAGIAGALVAQYLFIASPDNLYWTTSGTVMIMLIVGGTGTLSGPILGAATVRLMRNLLSSRIAGIEFVAERWETALGLIFVLFVLFAPRGIIGLLRGAWGQKRHE